MRDCVGRIACIAAPNVASPPGGLRLPPQVKNAGRKLGRRCDMCSNYEKQLQVIQGQEADTRDQVCPLCRRRGAPPALWAPVGVDRGGWGWETFRLAPAGQETADDAAAGQRSPGEERGRETKPGRFRQAGERGNRCQGHLTFFSPTWVSVELPNVSLVGPFF